MASYSYIQDTVKHQNDCLRENVQQFKCFVFSFCVLGSFFVVVDFFFFSNTIIFAGLHKNGGSGVKPLRKLDTANITYHCFFTTSLVFNWLTGYIQSLVRVSKIISVCTFRMLQV